MPSQQAFPGSGPPGPPDVSLRAPVTTTMTTLVVAPKPPRQGALNIHTVPPSRDLVLTEKSPRCQL